MASILLNLAITLDGFIEGPNGEYDWCFTDQDYGITDFLARCEAILFGRKSYEVLLDYDPDAYSDKMKYIFSRTLHSVAGKAVVLQGDVAEEIAKIKQRTQGDIWFFGGADLLHQLMEHDLIDEYHLSVHPVLLGSGKRLFPEDKGRNWLELKSFHRFSSGLVQLVYAKATQGEEEDYR